MSNIQGTLNKNLKFYRDQHRSYIMFYRYEVVIQKTMYIGFNNFRSVDVKENVLSSYLLALKYY